jgi:hypothetical protein
MRSIVLPGVVLALQFTVLLGCASIPGSTGEEQAEGIDHLVKRTLADLDKQDPNAREIIASSVGYAVMSNKVTKIPLVGAGSGYGVAINTKTNEKTYIKMVRLDLGAGWGARAVRPVIIFRDEKKFNGFIKGRFMAHAGAEAAAKVGETGAAGGGEGGASSDKGYVIYLITDTGVSATVTAGIISVRPVELKK